MKDFKVMSEEDRKDFGKIIEDIKARREAGQLQTQEASEAEEEAAAVSEPAAGAIPVAQVTSVVTDEVALMNAQIQI
jgi:orotate phosphoribosyltransferase